MTCIPDAYRCLRPCFSTSAQAPFAWCRSSHRIFGAHVANFRCDAPTACTRLPFLLFDFQGMPSAMGTRTEHSRLGKIVFLVVEVPPIIIWNHPIKMSSARLFNLIRSCVHYPRRFEIRTASRCSAAFCSLPKRRTLRQEDAVVCVFSRRRRAPPVSPRTTDSQAQQYRDACTFRDVVWSGPRRCAA